MSSNALAQRARLLGGWRIASLTLPQAEQARFRFERDATRDWLEVELLPHDTSGSVLRRLTRCSVRYRGELVNKTPELLKQASALVLGLAETVNSSLEQLGVDATLADALGARRRAETMRFSRASLRALLAPEVTAGSTLAGGFALVDVYPASHSQERAGARLELALEFHREVDDQRVIVTVGPRSPDGRAYVETEHFSLGYLTLGRSEPAGVEALLQQLALVFQLRDHSELQVIFPDTLADVRLPLLAAAATTEMWPRTDATLNLAISSDCAQACRFCSVRELSPPTTDVDALLTRYLADLSDSSAKGITRLRLNGYDPLTYPRVLEVLRFAVELGFDDLHVFSPATVLAERGFCEDLLATTPAKRQFYVPLYGLTPTVHDAVVGKSGAFASVMSALDNLTELSGAHTVTLITAVTQTGLDELPRLRQFARERGFAFAAHMPYPSSESRSDKFYVECPKQSEVARTLATSGSPLIVRGVAPCVAFKEFLAQGAGFQQWLSLDQRMAGVPGAEYRSTAFRHGAGDRDRGAFTASTIPCPHASECALREPCGAELLRAYVERFGADEFHPISLGDLMLSAQSTPGGLLTCEEALAVRKLVDTALASAATGAGAAQLVELALAGDRALRLRLDTWDGQHLEVLWGERGSPREQDQGQQALTRGSFYWARPNNDLRLVTPAALATLRRLLDALADAKPELALPRFRAPRPREDQERLSALALLGPLSTALQAALSAGMFVGWALQEARAYRYDRWEVDVRLQHVDGRQLGFLVHAKPDESGVFAETDRFGLSYYSDDFSAARHEHVYARDREHIEAFVNWLRGWDERTALAGG